MIILSKNLIEAQICALDTGAEWIDPDLFQNNIRAIDLAFRCAQVQSGTYFFGGICKNTHIPTL